MAAKEVIRIRIEAELIALMAAMAYQQRRSVSAIGRDLLIEALAARRYDEAMREMATWPSGAWPKREEADYEVEVKP